MAKYICVVQPKCPPTAAKVAPKIDVPPPVCKPKIIVTTNPCKIKLCDPKKKDCGDYGYKALT